MTGVVLDIEAGLTQDSRISSHENRFQAGSEDPANQSTHASNMTHTRIGELVFLDHFAPLYKIPVPEHLSEPVTESKLREKLTKWGAAIVKPDVLAGKRGKAGLVRRVESPGEAFRVLPQQRSVCETNLRVISRPKKNRFRHQQNPKQTIDRNGDVFRHVDCPNQQKISGTIPDDD